MTMLKFPLNVIKILLLTGYAAALNKSLLTNQKLHHAPKYFNDENLLRLADMSDVDHINEILDNICIKRVVSTRGHQRVKNYIIKSMENLGWSVETDRFLDKTPNFGKLEFENVISRLNPNASRYLALACHFDSKYTREGDFVGATDSAVPCAQMINLASVMKSYLDDIKRQDISLMFIFFDGEEAFKSWGPTDSIYGARHLAKKWQKTLYPPGNTEGMTELDRIDVLVLLDLIGAPDPTFYNYFENTEKWYGMLINAERKLAAMRRLEKYSYENPEQTYFQPYSVRANIEDDHIPFLKRGVPVLHLIPSPFPSFWHQSGDNRGNIDMAATENINKILRIFVASYLGMDV
ncbi:glutaminyl-peptide cyclotransferase [Neodiprion lecontei]|uniref:glutaminyl-peptide cyclotransferase n=1 Tax=Neodiprion lecontei TaxID=441921 RepID=A0A6J0B252_NEOLC|nr:glutaminyl-peptide cyclotransferase [Neodiprion lecontei]